MFTGIIEETGTVREIRRGGASARLAIEAGALPGDLEIGDSVAVDGVCLTVTAIEGSVLRFDVITETLRKSTLGDLRPGGRVNLEGALRVGDRLSGHFVMGHVDGVGEVVRRADEAGQTVFRIRAPSAVAEFVIEKGSVAVSGVSLTTWDVAGDEFSVGIVPHTLAVTTLADLRRGASVNLEADVLGRWIVRRLTGESAGESGGGVTLEKLREAGWDASS